MKTMTITITISMPDEMDAELAAPSGDAGIALEASSDDTLLSSSVLARIATAPIAYRDVLTEFAERLELEFGCTVAVPTSKREDYLNVYSGKTRVASFMVRDSNQLRGPRAEIYCAPENAEAHPPAEPDLHNGRPVQAKIYLGDEGAVDAAAALVRIAIDEKC